MKLLELCNGCYKEPRLSTIAGLGYQVECSRCGIAIPFPPAESAITALREWNERQEALVKYGNES